MEANYDRAFGVYGICMRDNKLLVIRKNRGPYIHRFDLPGGQLEQGETLIDAMKREFSEETGFEITIISQAGTTDFQYPCKWKEFTHVHHIAVFYHVDIAGGELLSNPVQFEGQDSLEALWIPPQDLNIDNASPLVLKAVESLSLLSWPYESQIYDEWELKTSE
ncbi:NUDIX hydrolase [Priestia megaterium]|uniref:NUDIX hydrolase n=1 Tax=Priestia megaterium TaxID=1404 RepID=UPI0022B9134D|nr:NUDIX hydrolase [Priestia megaterium]MCZ8493249.1 NUDIX hydrolase [Priestia megaterium]